MNIKYKDFLVSFYFASDSSQGHIEILTMSKQWFIVRFFVTQN